MSPTGTPFGLLPDGRVVTRYALESGTGLRLDVLDLGATVQSLHLPDGTNVVLGFADVDGYLAAADQFHGAVVGRFANRIAGGTFELDGVTHRLSTNDGPHTLHGGADGFHRRLWQVEHADAASVRLTLVSPDGDQGFPGCLTATVTYRVVGDEVHLDYRAESGAATVVNLTSHAYFNLAGEDSGSVAQHLLTVEADDYTPVGPDLVPTGEVAGVAGTPYDFRTPTPTPIGAGGQDHNLVLRGQGLRRVALLEEPRSGRTLEVSSDQPGLQLYPASAFPESVDGAPLGTGGLGYGRGAGVALETQHFPDSPHRPGFPSTVLRPGAPFASTTVWRFGRGG